jgi:hypothetical protein
VAIRCRYEIFPIGSRFCFLTVEEGFSSYVSENKSFLSVVTEGRAENRGPETKVLFQKPTPAPWPITFPSNIYEPTTLPPFP